VRRDAAASALLSLPSAFSARPVLAHGFGQSYGLTVRLYLDESQFPKAALIILYTVLGLWILSQPFTE
jgi:hypothetical protein